MIFQYRLNIYSEYFQKIEHNLLGYTWYKNFRYKKCFSHSQALSQCSSFIKSNNFNEYVSADTAGSAERISKNQNKNDAAIASTLSAETYNLEIIKKNIEKKRKSHKVFNYGKKYISTRI